MLASCMAAKSRVRGSLHFYFRPLVKFPGSPTLLMANRDHTVEEANQLITESKLDLITFGRPFIYNPVKSTR